ncbi:GNAT family N-acetyltransferase [Bacillus sp. 03113]|uniref:GNAT family N-acetyltransferase n=1 Tax=Bacillus sp. 03113 TaxID=2578211 RepID=UPI00114474A9|nr:GNAT family N-acetyltransferase [Bacillus sp. 03113]
MEVIIVKNDQELNDAFLIRKKVFIDEQNVPTEIEIDEFENSSVHFVLYNEKVPCGAGRLRVFPSYAKVERICILPSNRKGGSGKAIMNKIEEYAKEQNISILKLNAQSHAIPFYKKLGYEIISEEFFEAGIPHMTMQKTLSAV